MAPTTATQFTEARNSRKFWVILRQIIIFFPQKILVMHICLLFRAIQFFIRDMTEFTYAYVKRNASFCITTMSTPFSLLSLRMQTSEWPFEISRKSEAVRRTYRRRKQHDGRVCCSSGISLRPNDDTIFYAGVSIRPHLSVHINEQSIIALSFSTFTSYSHFFFQ